MSIAQIFAFEYPFFRQLYQQDYQQDKEQAMIQIDIVKFSLLKVSKIGAKVASPIFHISLVSETWHLTRFFSLILKLPTLRFRV